MREQIAEKNSSFETKRESVGFDNSKQSATNNALNIALIIFLALIPIPFGSNRPVFWALSALVISIIALVYFTSLMLRKSQFRYSLTRLKPSLVLFLILLGYIVVQIIPFGTWLSPININIDDLIISSKSLSLTPTMSLLSLIQFASYGLLFFLVLQLSYNFERAQLLLIWIFILTLIYAAYSIFALTQLNDPILFMEKWAYNNVATATFVNRNSFATFLAFGLVIGSAFCMNSLSPDNNQIAHKKSLFSFWLYFLGVIIIIAALLTTQSRMGVFAGITGSLITLLLIISKTLKSKKLVLLFSIFGIIAMSVLILLYGDGLVERLSYVESSADGRLSLYLQIVKMIAERPFTGYGAGSFELAFPLFHQLPVSPDVVWDKAHNTYLALWSELGIFFGSIPIIIIIIFGFSAWRIYIFSQRRWLYSAISLGAISVGFIHSFVDFSLEIQAVAYLFVTILAIGISGASRSTSSADKLSMSKEND